MAFTGNNGRTTIRRTARGFDLVRRLLAAAAGLVLLLLAVGLRAVAASLPRRAGEARAAGARLRRSTVALDARAIATVRGESFLDVLRGQGYLHAQERFFQMDLLRRSSAGELAELFGERALEADRGAAPVRLSRARARAARGAAGRADRVARRLHRRRQRGPRRSWARARPSTGSPARAPRPWLPEDSLLVVLTFYTMLSNNDVVRARAGRHARRAAAAAVRLPDAVDVALRSPRAWEHRRATRRAAMCRCRSPAPTSSISGTRRAPPRDGAPRVEPPLIGARVEQLGRRCDARRRRPRDRRERSAPELAAAEHLLSRRARVARPRAARRQHSGLARRADRREQRRRVGRDGQQRRSERLGRRRGRSRRSESLPARPTATRRSRAHRGDRRRGRRARAHRNARRRAGVPSSPRTGSAGRSRCTRRGSSRRGSTSTSWASRRPPTSRARACSSRAGPGPSLNWVLADRAGDIALGRQRPAAAARRLRRLAARVARRRQPLVARPAAAAGRARRPRRRAVHGQQPHAAARARRRRQPHVDAAAAREAHRRAARRRAARSTSATSSRCSSTRAPKATSRSARRFSRSSRPTSASRSCSERASSRSEWNGHADVDQAGVPHAARVLPRAARAHARAAARAGDRGGSRASSIAGRSPTKSLRRLLDERPAHLLTSEHADWRAFLRQCCSRRSTEIERDGALDAQWGEVNVLDVGASVRRQPRAARGAGCRCRARRCRARWSRCAWRRRATAPCCAWPSRPARRKTACSSSRAARAATSCRRSFAISSADWLDGAPTPFLAGEPVARFALVP